MFNALVTVLVIVQGRRTGNSQLVPEVYIERHFNYAAAASRIIHSMNRLFANASAPERALSFRAAQGLGIHLQVHRPFERVAEGEGSGDGKQGDGRRPRVGFRRDLRAHLLEIN